MQKILSVEELIVTDSFINYCYQENTGDIFRWNHYLLQYPEEKKTVDEARGFILHLKEGLLATEKEEALERFRKAIQDKQSPGLENIDLIKSLNEMLQKKRICNTWFAAAASIVLIVLLAAVIVGGMKQRQTVVSSHHNDVKKNENAPTLLRENGFARTMAGEKKQIFLPDGSKVTMNAMSTLHLDSAFGKNARVVYLEGEAFFDVAHRSRSPFIVRLTSYDVKVMGTKFNVRSYAGDKTSETALVKGKVEIILKTRSAKRLFLKPNEKAVISAYSPVSLAHGNTQARRKGMTDVSVLIKPLTIGKDGNSVIETGRMQNRLEINDETFEEIKTKLERWYGVQIVFKDKEVARYTFTAAFENETIDQVLKALQLSYSFHYSIKKKQIILSK